MQVYVRFYSRPGYFATSTDGENQKYQARLQEVTHVDLSLRSTLKLSICGSFLLKFWVSQMNISNKSK